MAIYFKTKTPKKLLARYKAAIDAGHINTWSYDSDGDFTHTAEQWKRRAWLRQKIFENQHLALYILTPKDTTLSSAVYAVFHGRFIESMLSHCEELFDEARATAMPDSGDVI